MKHPFEEYLISIGYLPFIINTKKYRDKSASEMRLEPLIKSNNRIEYIKDEAQLLKISNGEMPTNDERSKNIIFGYFYIGFPNTIISFKGCPSHKFAVQKNSSNQSSIVSSPNEIVQLVNSIEPKNLYQSLSNNYTIIID